MILIFMSEDQSITIVSYCNILMHKNKMVGEKLHRKKLLLVILLSVFLFVQFPYNFFFTFFLEDMVSCSP